MITVLCIDEKSNYKKIKDQDLDLWDIKRNAYNYNGTNKIIGHPPCQQWSKLKGLAKENKLEKELGLFVWEKVQQYGGIIEHPAGTSLFKYVGANPKQIIKVNQNWWGFKAKKETLLYFNQVELLPTPLNFNAIEKKIEGMNARMRSRMTIEFCEYLINSIKFGELKSGI